MSRGWRSARAFRHTENREHRLETVIRLFSAIAEQRHVAAMRKAFIVATPLVFFGSIVVLLAGLPLPAYQDFMKDLFGPDWTLFGDYVFNATMGSISVLVSLALAWFLVREHPKADESRHSPIIAAMASFTTLLILVQAQEPGADFADFSHLGSSGIPFAVLSAVASAELIIAFSRPAARRRAVYRDEVDAILDQAMTAMPPVALALLTVVLLRVVLAKLGIVDPYGWLFERFGAAFGAMGEGLGRALTYVGLTQLLWFFGIHGENALAAVSSGLWDEAIEANAAAVAASRPPGEIFTQPFFDAFVSPGGSGAILALAAAILIASRRGNVRRLALISLAPGLFNISEFLVFGLPVILNPVFLLPFVAVPLLLTLATWAAMRSGLVPLAVVAVDWMTPPILGGWIAVGSPAGALLQLFNLVLGTAVYLPFVRLAERLKEAELRHALDLLARDAIAGKLDEELLRRPSAAGNLARVLAHDLGGAAGRGELFLLYQPQVAATEGFYGVEALLRWRHPAYGAIPPQLAVAIAEQSGHIHDLGTWILDEACARAKAWREEGLGDLRMSVNASVLQLRESDFWRAVASALGEHGLKPGSLEIEITEGIAMRDDAPTLRNLERLRGLGVRVAMDDFGMGHGSLQYLRKYPIETVKLDGSLSREVLADGNAGEIVATIARLCSSLGLELIAEFVETPEQRARLVELGCTRFQGFLYSPPLEADRIPDFARNLGGRSPAD